MSGHKGHMNRDAISQNDNCIALAAYDKATASIHGRTIDLKDCIEVLKFNKEILQNKVKDTIAGENSIKAIHSEDMHE